MPLVAVVDSVIGVVSLSSSPCIDFSASRALLGEAVHSLIGVASMGSLLSVDVLELSANGDGPGF